MSESPEEFSVSRRRAIIAFCCLSVLVVSVDGTIVNVGLPSIERSFHASVSGLQWVADAYTLVVASLLMLSGSFADRFGRRKVFQIGMLAFTLGSLLCSVAPSLPTLVGARAIQALGASALNPVALAIISHAIPDRRQRAAATGIWSGVAGLGIALGPVCGGALIAAFGWRSIFWFNLPIGAIAIIGTQLVAPESKASKPRRIDPAGQILMIAMIATLTGGIIEGAKQGWGSPLIVILFVIAVCSAAGFAVVERRVSEPLLDLRYFKSVPFSGATVNAVAAFGALGGFLFLNTLYLQDVRGYTPLHAGLLTVPLAAAMALTAPISGRVVGSRGARLPFVIAGICGLLAPLPLGLGVHESVGLLIVVYIVFGVSMGMVNSPIATTAVSGMPADQTGVAASVASTGRQMGNALGVAIAGAFVSAGTGAGFDSASRPAWYTLAACGAVVLVCGLISTGARARVTAANVERDSADRLPAASATGEAR